MAEYKTFSSSDDKDFGSGISILFSDSQKEECNLDLSLSKKTDSDEYNLNITSDSSVEMSIPYADDSSQEYSWKESSTKIEELEESSESLKIDLDKYQDPEPVHEKESVSYMDRVASMINLEPFSKDEYYRIWTDSSDAFKIKARFLNTTDGKVYLLDHCGSKMSIDFNKLSQIDQMWIRDNIKPIEKNPEPEPKVKDKETIKEEIKNLAKRISMLQK